MDEEPKSRMLLADNRIFEVFEYQTEADLERRVAETIEFVFGPKVLYFDIRQRVSSRARKVNVTDGVLLEVRNGKDSRLWLVEYELGSHDLYSHVQPQIMGFIRSLRNPQTLRDVQLALYEEIRGDESRGKLLRESLGPDEDLFFFLDRVLHRKCGVVIVIDEVNPQLSEICEDLERYGEVRVIEFKTYLRGDKEIYHFNPFVVEEKEISRPELPAYVRRWEERLKWVNPETRHVAFELTKRLEDEFLGISHLPQYRWYYFYKGKSHRKRSLFAVLLLSKKSVSVRIRVDPSRFEDRLGITKKYKGWFFREGERGFTIRSPDQLDYALELIEQAYNYAEGKEP